MQAFGDDEWTADGERPVLKTAVPRSWTARVAGVLRRAEFPGTAVLIEEQWYQVVDAEGLPDGRVAYTFEPWPDAHAIRIADRYDEATEGHRQAEHQAGEKRERNRVGVFLLAPVTGQLPAVVQNALGRELGVLPQHLTLVSIIAVVFGAGYAFTQQIGRSIDEGGFPISMVVSVFFLIESAGRFFIVMTQHRPIANSIGFLGYLAFWLVYPRRAEIVSPFAVEAGYEVHIGEPGEERALQDHMLMVEPLLTLLATEDQWRLRSSMNFEPRRLAAPTAVIILLCSLGGVWSSFSSLRAGGSVGALITLLAAGGLVVEQIVRLRTFPYRPAASVLRFLVRPVAGRLLRQPVRRRPTASPQEPPEARD